MSVASGAIRLISPVRTLPGPTSTNAVTPAADIDRVERDALELVDRATEEAKAGAFPSPDALETELWADGGSSWRS